MATQVLAHCSQLVKGTGADRRKQVQTGADRPQTGADSLSTPIYALSTPIYTYLQVSEVHKAGLLVRRAARGRSVGRVVPILELVCHIVGRSVRTVSN